MHRTRKRKIKGKSKLHLTPAKYAERGDDRFLLPTATIVEGSAVLASDATHVFVVNQIVIALSPIEYALLKRLLQEPGTPVSTRALIQVAFPTDLTEDEAGARVSRHITNIRPKLWQTPLTINAVNTFGDVLYLSDSPTHFSQKKRKDR